MSNLNDLIAEMDRVNALPMKERGAERMLLFRRVEHALRLFVERDQKLTPLIQRFRPAIRELQIRLIALEKAAPAMPDMEMLREYYGALARVRATVDALERLVKPITSFEDLP